MKSNFFLHVDEKIITPALIAVVHISDLIIRTLGKTIAHKASCRLGAHDWRPVSGSEHLRYCERCGDIDDVRLRGIDSVRERSKNRQRRRLRVKARREQRRRGRRVKHDSNNK